MKLHIMSDLHTELRHFADTFHPHVTEVDVVVLGGDIGTGLSGLKWAGRGIEVSVYATVEEHILKWERNPLYKKQLIYVPGNHEYYGFDYDTLRQKMLDFTDNDIHVLDRRELIIGNVRFLGCTLWTDFQLFGADAAEACRREANLYMADFAVIFRDGRRFKPLDYMQLFDLDRAFLEEKLNTPFEGKTIVITHHLPSFLSVPDRFKSSPLSAAFASNLDELVVKADLWIHGHSHDSANYMIGNTPVVCNPRGYASLGEIENKSFDENLVIEL